MLAAVAVAVAIELLLLLKSLSGIYPLLPDSVQMLACHQSSDGGLCHFGCVDHLTMQHANQCNTSELLLPCGTDKLNETVCAGDACAEAWWAADDLLLLWSSHS